MSLERFNREILVRLEVEKAYQTYDDCLLMVANQRWSSAASRLYYATFHAVCALLISDGHPVKTHKGAGVAFSHNYIHTGQMASQYGELYFQLERLRERSDYDCFFSAEEGDVRDRLALAKEMIDTIAAMVKV